MSNQLNVLTSSIINNKLKTYNYDTTLVPLKDLKHKIGIIYPNVISMFNYKNTIDNIIQNFEISMQIIKLYHTNNDEYNNIPNIKSLYFNSNDYTSESIPIWISDTNTSDIDTIDDLNKFNNFENAINQILSDDEIYNIIIFIH